MQFAEKLPHIAIVIVHYNQDEATDICLRSLSQLDAQGYTYSVTVIDNGSYTPYQPNKAFLPERTNIIRSEQNLGFSEGNNLGFRIALDTQQPDYLLILNNDTKVDPQSLTQLLLAAQRHPKCVVVPKIYFFPDQEFHHKSYLPEHRGKVLWYGGGVIDWGLLDAFHKGVDELDRGQFDQEIETDFATGCCFLMPVAALKDIGGFDPRYFLYFEDVDLCWRLQRKKYLLVVCPSAKIWHQNAGSSGGAGSVIHQYYQTRNRLYFFGKFGRWKSQQLVLRLAIRLFLFGTPTERRAVQDWVTNTMGKQQVV